MELVAALKYHVVHVQKHTVHIVLAIAEFVNE